MSGIEENASVAPLPVAPGGAFVDAGDQDEKARVEEGGSVQKAGVELFPEGALVDRDEMVLLPLVVVDPVGHEGLIPDGQIDLCGVEPSGGGGGAHVGLFDFRGVHDRRDSVGEEEKSRQVGQPPGGGGLRGGRGNGIPGEGNVGKGKVGDEADGIFGLEILELWGFF